MAPKSRYDAEARALRETLSESPGALAAVRRAAGLTQAQAAAQIGVPRHTWARWERGERIPTGLYRHALAIWVAEHA